MVGMKSGKLFLRHWGVFFLEGKRGRGGTMF